MRSTFLGTGAFVGMIEGESKCSFWADEPTEHGFDRERLIAVDLSRTPNAAAAQEIAWSAVEVDDCILSSSGKPAGTTVGPRWPELQLMGAVYLEENVWKSIPEPLRPACPPAGAEGRDYEYMNVVYWSHTSDPRSGRRYAGHHAEILQESGKLALVAIYPAGLSLRPDAQAMSMWIDLASPEQCDAGADSLTQIGIGAAPKSGPLFLPNGRIAAAERSEVTRSDEEAVNSAVVLPLATGETSVQGLHSGGPKVPPLLGEPAAQATGSSSGPKLPPYLGAASEHSNASSGPKIPPWSGEASVQSNASSGPKLPPLLGDASARSHTSSGPKLPPLQGDASVRSHTTSGPKLPPWLGEASVRSNVRGGAKVPAWMGEPSLQASRVPPTLPLRAATRHDHGHDRNHDRGDLE